MRACLLREVQQNQTKHMQEPMHVWGACKHVSVFATQAGTMRSPF